MLSTAGDKQPSWRCFISYFKARCVFFPEMDHIHDENSWLYHTLIWRANKELCFFFSRGGFSLGFKQLQKMVETRKNLAIWPWFGHERSGNAREDFKTLAFMIRLGVILPNKSGSINEYHLSPWTNQLCRVHPNDLLTLLMFFVDTYCHYLLLPLAKSIARTVFYANKHAIEAQTSWKNTGTTTVVCWFDRNVCVCFYTIIFTISTYILYIYT